MHKQREGLEIMTNKLNAKGFQLWLIPLIVVVIAGLGFAGWYIWDKNQKQTAEEQASSATTSSPSSDEDNNQNTASNQQDLGKIRGSLTFPSEHIPSSIEACALNVDNGVETCTKERINSNEFVYGVGFELTVTAGNYKLLARNTDPQEGQNADDVYYDEYIRQTTFTNIIPDPCNDSSLMNPIIISVAKDQIVQNVVVGDWYYPSGLDLSCN